MKNLIHNYTGASLQELKQKYGTGSSGFHEQGWYKNENFYTEKPEAGVYEIYFDEKENNMTSTEQKARMKEDFDFTHLAILAEAILEHYKNTGERLMENWYSRVNEVVSDGSHVCIGFFGSGGLYVYHYWDDGRDGYLGLSAARKSEDTGNSETLEDRILKLEEFKRSVLTKIKLCQKILN